MTEPQSPLARIGQWAGTWGSIIAPVTVLSALLFYFGYVSSRAQYEYFGIDVDAIGLDTQDYVMRSPQPLLTPLLALILLLLGGLALHARIERRIAAVDEPQGPGRAAIERWTRAASVLGVVLIGVGFVLLLLYPVAQRWALYGMATPLLLAAGAAVAGYAARIGGRLRAPQPARGHVTAALLYVTIAASLFWATATVAQWSGRGQAREQARTLTRLPHVILDTKEPLYLRDPVVEESRLAAVEDQEFRYRYRRLRLLIVGNDRLFLVPERWSASNSTLVVELDGSVRVRFQFQNDPPG